MTSGSFVHAFQDVDRTGGGFDVRAGAPAESKDVSVTGPDIAENGAVVPVGVATTLPGAKKLLLLVEKNPNMLAASFDIPAGTDPSVGTRVKMGQSSNVYALVKADGKYYVASKEIKVTLEIGRAHV
mgnify:CR=1 FL=1